MKVKFYFLIVLTILMTIFVGCSNPEKTWKTDGAVFTMSASDITASGATLSGYLSAPDVSIMETGFLYDDTREMTNQKRIVANNAFSAVLDGLNPRTTYYYRAYATAYGVTKTGEVMNFETLGNPGLSSGVVIDFETGDFSQASFVNNYSYPWAITYSYPYEGYYCMKSTCEGAHGCSSVIELPVNFSTQRQISFYLKVSSESSYDGFYFYIDSDCVSSRYSGECEYVQLEFTIPAGSHTLRWEYSKDGSVSSGNDCAYVDRIVIS